MFKSGEIQADGKDVSLQELDNLLAANTRENGVVYYYREGGKEEPPPQAMDVIAMAMKHRRPMMMSDEPDFSTSVGFDGIPHEKLGDLKPGDTLTRM